MDRQWNALHKTQIGTYQAYSAAPEKFIGSLNQCISTIGDHFNEHPQAVDSTLQGFYLEAIGFSRIP
ncbi:DEAD_2 protein, partial [Pseudomonas syringae pv. pisi str. 1704B]